MLNNTILIKTLGMIFALIILVGCADYVDHDDWSIFKKAIEDSHKNTDFCNDFFELSVVRGETRNSSRYSVDALDFIYKKSPKFNQCDDEYKLVVDDYCSRYMIRAVSGLTNSYYGDEPSRKFIEFCGNELRSALFNINEEYTLPTAESDYIIFEGKGVMVRPKEIEGISFKEEFPNALWKLMLHREEGDLTLLFGNKELFEKAKMELSKTNY